MTEIEDPFAQTGGEAALFSELVGSRQLWLSLCREVASGDEDATKRLNSLDSREARALSSQGRASSTSGDPLEVPVSSFDRAVGEVIRDLAFSLRGLQLEPEPVKRALVHFESAGLVSAGSRAPRAPAKSHGHVVADAAVELVMSSDSPARGFVELLIAELMSARARAVADVSVPVLFGGEGQEIDDDGRSAPGASGHLTLERLAVGPAGLHPDPSVMGFLETDAAMHEAIRNAWATSRLVGSDTCVVWSLRRNSDTHDPVTSVGGGSLGGAFAVALDELATRTGLVRSLMNRYLLDPQAAISASIDESGRLHTVLGLPNKIEAAERSTLNVVVASECVKEAQRAVRTGMNVRVQHAANVPEAVRVTRTHANPRFRWAVGTATVLALTLGSAVFGIIDAQGTARVESFAARLASQAVTLANSDPRRAALFALASHELHPNDDSQQAMAVVAQNNLNVTGSVKATDGNIADVAVNESTLLVSDDSMSVKVLSFPDLARIGEIKTENPDVQLAAWGSTEFALLDGDQLKLYASDQRGLPVLVETVDVPFGGDDSLGAPEVFGPFVDRLGGTLVIAEDLRGIYWSAVTREAIEFNLKDDAWLAANSSELVRVTAASGFGPSLEAGVSGDRPSPTNESTGEAFLLATNLGQLIELHLTQSSPDDPWREDPVSVWLDQRLLQEDRGTRITALGWFNDELLIGTDAGISARDLNTDRETAFPFGGLNEAVGAIATHTGTFSQVAAAQTASGVTLLSPTDSTSLNNTTQLAAGRDPVLAVTAADDQTWVAGRAGGVVAVIDAGSHTTDLSGDYSAKVIAQDGTLLLSQGDQQRATGLANYDTAAQEWIERGYDLGEALSELPFLNSVAGDGTFAVAGGHVRGSGGIVIAWERPEAEPHILEFAVPDASVPSTDIVSKVAYDAEAGVIAAFNVLDGAVALWSTTTWKRVGYVELRQGETTGGSSSKMSVSADGSRLAVTVDKKISVIETATGKVLSSFQGDRAEISPDGTRLALWGAEGADVTFVNDKGVKVARVELPVSPHVVAWSRDGSRFAVADWDRSQIAFVNTSTYQVEGYPWRNPGGLVPTELLWTDQGTLLVANGAMSDGFFTASGLEMIDTAKTTWLDQLCALAPVPLTEAEWTSAGGQGITAPDPCNTKS
ncbi:WD40 repeat domain-containing protein [Promicromonospora sp. CA-289599]|uniref:WD40 repeat domain-containing protein n=1 Tax=Promicromonospora sp. CA-289599 TaxID=3240014 RepID=UPI003D919E38